MGASQSNPKGGHFEPAGFERNSLHSVPSKSAKGNKNSFSKHQLSKLLRKGSQVANEQVFRDDGQQEASPPNEHFAELNASERKYFVPSARQSDPADGSGDPMRADKRPSNGYEANGQPQKQQQRQVYAIERSEVAMQPTIRHAHNTRQLDQTSGNNNFNTLQLQQQQQQQQQLMSMQSRFNCSSTSASLELGAAHGAQTLERQLHEKPFRAAGSSSTGTSSSSSASSFHESAPHRVHQQHLVQTRFVPDASFSNSSKQNTNANQYALGRELVANGAVAMQQPAALSRPHHQRANSSGGGGGSLSWSKQAQQALHQPQAQAQAQQELDSLELQFNNFVPLHQHQQQQQQQRSAIPNHTNQIEQFYARNLHLLTDQQQQQQLYSPAHDFYHNPALLYDDFQQQQLSPSSQASFASSAPTQRRYKWPKQHQHFPQDPQQAAIHQQRLLHHSNSNTLSNFHHKQQQQPQSINVDYATAAANNYVEGPASESLIYYAHTQTSASQNNNNNNNHVGQRNLMNDFGPFCEQPTKQQQAFVPSSIAAGASLRSTKKAATISSKASRARNPLSAIFNFATTNSSSNNNNQLTSHKQYQSNTIHLAGAKSAQNLLQQANGRPAGGSLKRVKSSPLTAQQSSYEAMRTIDMYLIRQIARTCMDFEMEQKIELEIRLRELASQSLLEARNEIDVLEVEKSLLTSDQRMNCYAAQLEEQRKRLSNPSLSTDSGRASKSSNWGARRDVIGASSPSSHDHEHELVASISASSPSCGSLSKSSQSSPSKLSPVSGESANSTSDSQPARSRAQNLHMNAAAAAAATAAAEAHTRQVAPSSAGSSGTLTRRRNGLSNKSWGSSGKSAGAASKLARQRERLKQTITSQSNINWNMVADNKATLSLSELRIPLMWRDVDHFKGRGEYRRYAVFCLLKINSQIYDTRLISDVDRQHTDLTFDDLIVFSNVEHDFELTFEVYSCVYLEHFSLSSTPRKLKEKLSNSVSRAMGRRLATQTASANFIKELEAYDKSYRFAMIASARLRLADASDSVKTYDLQLVSPEAHGRHATSNQFAGSHNRASANANTSQPASLLHSGAHATRNHTGIVTASNQRDVHKNTLPLFGHFCCRLHVRPDVFDKCIKSGYLRVGVINLPVSLDDKSHSVEESKPLAEHADKKRHKERVRGRSDWSANDDSGKSSSSNDEMAAISEKNSATDETNSMLRSALAASSKLATISMSTATVHWALLRNFTLHLWHIDEHKLQLALRRGHAPQVDISCKQPFCISIDKYTRLLRVSNSSLTLETDKGCFVIGVHDVSSNKETHRQDEIGQWLRPIEQMIYDSHIWSSALQHYPPTSQRNKHSKQ